MGETLDIRRSTTNARFEQLRAELQEAEKLLANKACVYATGSFGRGEAGAFSDLDVFIAGKAEGNDRLLSPLDEILVKADLIAAVRKLNIPDFSGDGEYLTHYTVHELVKTLGTRSHLINASGGSRRKPGEPSRGNSLGDIPSE